MRMTAGTAILAIASGMGESLSRNIAESFSVTRRLSSTHCSLESSSILSPPFMGIVPQEGGTRKRGEKIMKKAIAIVLSILMLCTAAVGCTEAEQVSYNVSKEADNFNVTRKLTVINARTDTIMLEMTGTFSLQNNSENELEIICEVADGQYKKHLVYLNDWTCYVVEDVSGANVDKYRYEINFLPEWGVKVTQND